MSDNELAGVGVLVTRPKSQAAELVEAITARGGLAIEFAVMEIVARETADVVSAVQGLRDPDIAVFVSPNSVRYGIDYADAAQIAVVGPTTAAAVDRAGRNVDIYPASGHDSEHLLAEPGLQNVDGKVVRIIRGDSGRELLADMLRQRGATIDYLPVYSRKAPSHSAQSLADIEQRWHSGEIDVVTVMSIESLQNLVDLLPDRCKSAFGHTSLVTPAARVIKEVLDRFPGMPTTLAQGPQASDMVDAIVTCMKTQPGQT